jgi:hypothetical protein
VRLGQLEGLLRSVLGAGLHEVELAVLELEVGSEGVEEVARHLLSLVALQLLDQSEDTKEGMLAFAERRAPVFTGR